MTSKLLTKIKEHKFYIWVLIVIGLLTIFAPQPAKAQCTKNIANFSGGGKLEFVKMVNDFPSVGQSTFYYNMWASTPKDVSHFDIFVGTCLKSFNAGGTYTNTTSSSGLKPNKCWVLGQDGSITGKPWVMKYDCSVTKGDSVKVYFTLNDTFGLTKNATLLKYGTTVAYDSMCGPDIQCSTPVDLAYFSAKAVGNIDVINFTTFTETNNDTFIVQRSYDAKDWQNVGGVKGARNSSQKINYSVKIDLHDYSAKTRYYRIKQVDFDGTSTYSPEVKISSDPVVGFYPNPANEGQSIVFNLTNFDESSESKLLVINPVGDVVFSKDFTGSNVFEVNDLTKGVYCVQIASRHFTKVQKLVIK